MFEIFQIFDFPEIAPRYFLRVPGASTALQDPPRASFSAGLVESRDQPPLFENALPRRIHFDGCVGALRDTAWALWGLVTIPGGAPQPLQGWF